MHLKGVGDEVIEATASALAKRKMHSLAKKLSSIQILLPNFFRERKRSRLTIVDVVASKLSAFGPH